MFGADVDKVTLSNTGSAKITMNGRDTAWKLTMEHFYKGRELKGSGCGSSLAWYKEYSKGGKVLDLYILIGFKCCVSLEILD